MMRSLAGSKLTLILRAVYRLAGIGTVLTEDVCSVNRLPGFLGPFPQPLWIRAATIQLCVRAYKSYYGVRATVKAQLTMATVPT